MNGKEVINRILTNEDIKAATFAKKIGVTPPQIYDLRDGKIKGISSKIADKILAVYPRYNKSWLMTGIGEMFITEQTEKPKIKIDLKELAKYHQEMGTTAHWAKLGEEFKKRQRGMVERIRVAVPEAKHVRASLAFQHLINTNPTIALWAATGKDDKVVMDKLELEALRGQVAALKMLNESQSKEIEAIRAKTMPKSELL